MLKPKLDFLKCRVRGFHIIESYTNDKQLFHLTITYKNCIKVRLNDVKVPKRNTYLVSKYKKTDSIKIKIYGLFNSETIYLPIQTTLLKTSISRFEKSFSFSMQLSNQIYRKPIILSSLIGTIVNHPFEKQISISNSKSILKIADPVRAIIIDRQYSLTNIINIKNE